MRYALLLCILIVVLFGSPSYASDPKGTETLSAQPGLPTDYVWVLVCGFLVFFMQAGFCHGGSRVLPLQKHHKSSEQESH